MGLGSKEISVVLKMVGNQFTQGIGQASQGVGGMISKIQVWKVALVGAAGALFALAKGTAEYADGLLKTSQQIGVNVGELQGLIFAAEQSGSSFSGVNTGLRRFSQNLFDAGRGTGEAKDILEAFGIGLSDSEGKAKSMTDVIIDISKEFSTLPDGVTKAALAQKLFGRSGAELIPLLNEGEDGIRGLILQSEALGQITQKQAEDARDFNDRLNELNRSFRDIKNTVGAQVIPVFTDFFVGLRLILDFFKTGSLDEAAKITFEKMKAQVAATRKETELLAGTQERVAKQSTNDAKSRERNLAALLEKLNSKGKGGKGKLSAEQKEQQEIGKVLVANATRNFKAEQKLREQAAKEQEQLGQTIVDNESRKQRFQLNKKQQALRESVTIAGEELRTAELLNADKEQLAAKRLALLQAQQAQELALFEGTAEERKAIARRQEAELFQIQQEGMETLAVSMEEIAGSAANVFATGFFNPMKDNFLDLNDLAGSLENVFNQAADAIIQDLIRVQAQKAIVGAFDSGGSGGSGAGAFAGFFAGGGTIPPGQFGIVGENGPEIAQGGTSGKTIIPGDAIGGGVSVNMTVVAKDAQSFKKSKNQITSGLAVAIASAQRNL